MELLKLISEKSITKSIVYKLLVAILVMMLQIDHINNIKEIGARLYADNALSNITLRLEISQNIIQLLLVLLIHSFLYMAPKFYKAFENLKNILLEFAGDRELNASTNMLMESFWNKHQNLFYVFNLKHGNWTVNTLRLNYLIIWIFILLYQVWIPFSHNYLSYNWQGCITAVLLFTVNILYYFGLWCGFVLCYCIRELSNLEQIDRKNLNGKFRFNIKYPSETNMFRKLQYRASTVAVFFTFFSCLYLLILIVMVGMGTTPWNKPNDFPAFMLCIDFLIPSLFSLVPIVLCPSVFLSRILRKWKYALISDYESRIESDQESDKETLFDRIHAIHSDKIQYHWVGFVSSIIALLMNLFTIATTVISAITH